uniref:Abhydrolase_3 domain-containing protein n=1 Tax=Heterorhabditis bacteriophora TaxID=37862 RepID=A0A1I7X5V8_HETBA
MNTEYRLDLLRYIFLYDEGDVVEHVFGACTRNSYFRFIMSLGYIIPHSIPPFAKSVILSQNPVTLIHGKLLIRFTTIGLLEFKSVNTLLTRENLRQPLFSFMEEDGPQCDQVKNDKEYIFSLFFYIVRIINKTVHPIYTPGYYDAFIFSLIRRLGITVFSVDYRLAPEHPFPKPLEDCEAVVNELYNSNFEKCVDTNLTMIQCVFHS